MEWENKECPDCKNTGIVRDSSGTHTCFKCLAEGKLDQHTQNMRESRIKI